MRAGCAARMAAMISRIPTALAVGLGAAFGAGLRWGTGEVIDPGWLPWPTLAVNVVGAGLLGYLLSRAVGQKTPAWATAGVCGGLTTMSSFAVEIASLLDAALYGRALLYLGLTLGLGIGAYRVTAR